MRKPTGIVLLISLALLAGAASAQVQLHYSPLDTELDPGQTTRVSIMLDAPVDLRTIEVFVDYDPEVLGTVAGGSGDLFTSSGFILFQGFEETTPGSWHGYCVVMGSGDFITGPGELFHWDVEALAAGVSPITTVSIALAAPDGGILPEVTLPSTTVDVADPASPAGDLPGAMGGLRIHPNPFNPRAEVSFELTEAGPAQLAVFDCRGARLDQLHDGVLPAGPAAFTWNGRDRDGLSLPAGVYYFRLTTSRGVLLQKGTLLK